MITLSRTQGETNVSLLARRMPKKATSRVKGRGPMTGCLLLLESRGGQQRYTHQTIEVFRGFFLKLRACSQAAKVKFLLQNFCQYLSQFVTTSKSGCYSLPSHSLNVSLSLRDAEIMQQKQKKADEGGPPKGGTKSK